MTTETAFHIDCGGSAMLALLHTPAKSAQRGVVIVVGGPQYRVGSHRQFLLLARDLAMAGIPVLRFDYRGLGDSDGPFLGFEHINDDIAAAVDAFMQRVPNMREVVLWGLCDAAAAILLYAHKDSRIGGVVLLNPWVRTEATIARVYLRHYYLRRLVDPQFWRAAIRGGRRPAAAIQSLIITIARALKIGSAPAAGHPRPSSAARPLPARMADGLAKFPGRILLIMSGQDLTAREFEEVAGSRRWRGLLNQSHVNIRRLQDADHTFARRQWRDQVTAWTRDWLFSW